MWLRDLRYGWRALSRARGFTASAIAISGLVLGLAATVFSITRGVLLQPLPFHESDALVAVGRVRSSAPALFGASLPDFLDWREQLSPWMQELAVYGSETVRIRPTDGTLAVRAALTTTNMWSMLGVLPLQGRIFQAGDTSTDGPAVLMLGESLWRTHFGGSPHVIGSYLRLDGLTPGTTGLFEVVGVLPTTASLGYQRPPDIFLPLSLSGLNRDGTLRRLLSYQVIGRLKHDVPLAAASAALAGIPPAAYGSHTASDRIGVRLLKDHWVGGTREPLRLLTLAVLIVSLVGVANLSGLFLTHVQRRRQQFATQFALGAGRWALFRQLMAESLILSLGGALVAAATAPVLLAVVIALIPVPLPRSEFIGVDRGVVAFVLASAALTSLLIAAVPSWTAGRRAYRNAASATLTPGSRRSRWLLCGSQLILVVCLMSVAGNLMVQLWQLHATDLGFNPSNATLLRVDHRIRGDGDRPVSSASYRTVLADVAALPGVTSASLTFPAPLEDDFRTTVFAGGQTLDEVSWIRIGAGYFSAIGSRLVSGRELLPSEAFGGSSAVVNESFAKQAFAGHAIGQQVRFGEAALTIVGVSADARHSALLGPARPVLYVPFSDAVPAVSWLVVREDSTNPLHSALRSRVRAVLPAAVVSEPVTLAAWVDQRRSPTRFVSFLAGAFAVAGLVLGGCGVYSVMSFVAQGRRKEIAIRIAVGASPAGIARLLLTESLVVLLLALTLGSAATFVLAQVMGALVLEIRPSWSVGVGVGTLLSLVVLAASFRPVASAARIDPLLHLRSQ